MPSKIEWLRNPDGTQGYSINPVKGKCPVDCKDNRGKSYCYARRLYDRFKWNPEIRLDTDCFLPFLTTIRKKPCKIFVGSTMELFGEWVEPEWMNFIFERVKMLSEHTFIMLTKRPENLINWSPFPKNCWVGVSATNLIQYHKAMDGLKNVQAAIRFLSFEPLLESVGMPGTDFLKGIDWVIIGQVTPVSGKTAPKIEWVREIVEAADKAGIPIFIKDNLETIMTVENIKWMKRQEFPKAVE